MKKASKPVVVITGVSGGIGLATARRFASKGWIVVGTVRGRARPAGLRGIQIDLQVADMLKSRDLERVIMTAWRTYGRLDALICNAGYGLVGALDTYDYAQMDEQVRVNTLAPAELARHAVLIMRRQRSGVIVGVSSISGRAGFAGYSLYAASKFGLEGLFEALAMELAVSGVRVKLVEPSVVSTAFWKDLRRGNLRSPAGADAHDVAPGTVASGLSPDKVAEKIYAAATDPSSKLRYPMGQTVWVNIARRWLPERLVERILRKVITGN